MTKISKKAPVREAVGIFFEANHLREAISDLVELGIDRGQLGLLAAEGTVKEALGDFYDSTNKSVDTEQGPITAFVAKESLGDTFHDLGGGLIFIGTTAAGAIAVASAAILGGALAAAVAGIVGVVAVGGAMAMIIHQSDAEYLEEQVDEGHLLLFARLLDSSQEKRVIDILARHCSYAPRVHEVVPDKKGSARVVEPSPA